MRFGEHKTANISQAADQVLNRIHANQRAVWDRMMTPTDGKPQKSQKPEPPPPPKLPSLVDQKHGVSNHLPIN